MAGLANDWKSGEHYQFTNFQMFSNHVSFQFSTFSHIVNFIKNNGFVTQMPFSLIRYLVYGSYLAALFYCWDVVYSVYRDMKAEEVEGDELPMKITIPCISITCEVKKEKDQCR